MDLSSALHVIPKHSELPRTWGSPHYSPVDSHKIDFAGRVIS
jgi:hypothetical protein